MAIPKKLYSRKEEIAAEFLRIFEEHIAALMARRAEHRYKATDFAKRLFIHPRHLTNTLKLVTNQSVCGFMEERITAEAKKLLLETNLSVAEIGYHFAYEDPTNFTKFFKGMVGMTPLQYRKAAKSVRDS